MLIRIQWESSFTPSYPWPIAQWPLLKNHPPCWAVNLQGNMKRKVSQKQPQKRGGLSNGYSFITGSSATENLKFWNEAQRKGSVPSWGCRLAQWTRDQKVKGSIPAWGTRETSVFQSQEWCADSLLECPAPCVHDHVPTLKILLPMVHIRIQWIKETNAACITVWTHTFIRR